VNDDFQKQIDSLSEEVITDDQKAYNVDAPLNDEIHLLLKQEKNIRFWRRLAIILIFLLASALIYLALPSLWFVNGDILVPQIIETSATAPVKKPAAFEKSSSPKQKPIRKVRQGGISDRTQKTNHFKDDLESDNTGRESRQNKKTEVIDSSSDSHTKISESSTSRSGYRRYYRDYDFRFDPESDEITMCAFDPLYWSGYKNQYLEGYKGMIHELGGSLMIKYYSNERIAIGDFESRQCSMLSVSGSLARRYNRFIGSIDSFGSLPSYDLLRLTIKTLTSSKAARLMRSKEYEVISIIPAGRMFVFVSDKSQYTLNALYGKNFGVYEQDPAMQYLAEQTGMIAKVSSNQFIPSGFNNGRVDVAIFPATLFEMMELYKGLEPNGGILDYPLLMSTTQIIIHRDEELDDFGQASREYSSANFNKVLESIVDSEKAIPDKFWINLSDQEVQDMVEMVRQYRIGLRDDEVYNSKTLTILRKIRCRSNPSKSECSAADKE